MHTDQITATAPAAAPYTPSADAKQAFHAALENMAMASYRELPENMKRSYALGFVMGFDGLPFPKEAVENRAMDDGFMFGARAIHKGHKQCETEPILYA